MVGGTAADAGGACKLSVLSSECLPAEGIIAAFQFAEFRHVRWQLEREATSTVTVAEGANCGHRTDRRFAAARQSGRQRGTADIVAAKRT